LSTKSTPPPPPPLVDFLPLYWIGTCFLQLPDSVFTIRHHGIVGAHVLVVSQTLPLVPSPLACLRSRRMTARPPPRQTMRGGRTLDGSALDGLADVTQTRGPARLHQTRRTTPPPNLTSAMARARATTEAGARTRTRRQQPRGAPQHAVGALARNHRLLVRAISARLPGGCTRLCGTCITLETGSERGTRLHMPLCGTRWMRFPTTPIG
jgi:hypothetical protein